MEPVLCPLCTRSSLEPLLEKVSISAKMNGQSNVAGVLAYRCTKYDHAFFVRIADIEALQITTPPTGSKHKKNGSAGGTIP